MQAKSPYWKRINPLLYIFAMTILASVVAFQMSPTSEALVGTAIGTLLLGIGLMLGLHRLITKLGRNAPGKDFVAEVLIVHWRGQTSRFWGAYRYEWMANFAAQYMAYELDHLGAVHWEFGIQFRVHDQAARKAQLDAENLKPA
jgi:hypothetical protein